MHVLRVVTLGSRTGKYGGPFDTAVSQARLLGTLPAFSITVLAGSFLDDAPKVNHTSVNFVTRPVRSLFMRSGFAGCISLALCAELVRQVRRADVVHVSYARELVPMLAAAATLLYRKPLVVQPHGMLTARTSRLHRVIDIAARPLYKRAKRVIALTRVEAALLDSWAGTYDVRRIVVLGNPLPYAMNAAVEMRPAGRALFIARLEPRKRVCDFIEARKVAYDRGWSDVYEVVGPDQGDGEAVRAAAQSLPGLEYRGAVPATELDAILSRAGAFVLTSENEPWGNVLVAALVRGVPVVVTRSAALADEIEKNHMGLIVSDGHPEEVAEAVHRVLNTDWRTPEQGQMAREFAAARFDQTAIRDCLASIYTAVESR